MQFQTPPRSRLLLYSVILTALLGVAGRQVLAGAEAERVSAATVQVTTVVAAPDYQKPWQLKATETIQGSGAIIEGARILTNAHNVAWSASVEVSRPGVQKKFPARVAHIDHASDLAILTVDDAAFFDGVAPLEIGDLPRVESEVKAYGYPVGGDAVSATSGIVSRYGADTYVHGERELLTVQIDAALNPGNSGGPVVAGGKIVAIAMQGLEDGDNIGYGIPVPVIARFLRDAADGEVAGVPRLGIMATPMESDALREYLGMRADASGMCVGETAWESAAWGVLRRDDVIMAVDGVRIANDGTIPLAGAARVDWIHAITMHQVGDPMTLTLWRDGKSQDVTVTLGVHAQLVPLPSFPARCRYRVAGGIVFQPADVHIVTSLLESMPARVLTAYVEEATRTEARRELIVMASVLPHDVNRGYEDWAWGVVATVQGVAVRDFAHFNELVDGATGRWLDITFDDHSRLVMDLAAVRAADPEILERFAIPADRWPLSPATVAARP